MDTTKTYSKFKVTTFLLFFSIIAIILYLVNVFIYSAISLAFNIVESPQLLLFRIGLGFLSGSFIVAIIIGNWYYNRFTRFYYTFSAIWVGFSAYLFIASLIYGFIVLFSGQTFNTIGISLMVLAMAVSIYGILHARKIVITNIPTALPNLPASWQGKKAVWVSDLHLGQVYGYEFAEKVAQNINALAPDIIFIGGDLYDGTNIAEAANLIAPLKKLLAPQGIYFITGNHEEFGSGDRFISAIKSLGIRVLQDEKIELDGVQIIGVNYGNASNKDRFQKTLSELLIDKNKTSILLKHEPQHIEVAEGVGIALQISGHTHKAQQWPLGYFANLVYGRFAYGLNKSGNMQVYTSSGIGAWGPPIRVGTNCEIVVFTFESKNL
jgi:uncharacterized protein